MRRRRKAAPQFSISLDPMKKNVTLIILLLGVQLLLASCAPGQQGLQPGSTTQDYIIEVIPTPSGGNATITGILKKVSGTGSEPVPGTTLSLGVVLQNDQGTPMMGQLTMNTKLRAPTDKNGRFVFSEVPAGKYVLVFDQIISVFMLNDPKTGGDLIITANSDQIVDLGELVYEKLP
jgi:hypothetical protein